MNNREPPAINPAVQKTLSEHHTASEKLNADTFYNVFKNFKEGDARELAIFQFENYGVIDVPLNDKVFRVQIGEDENQKEIVTYQDVTELIKQAKTDTLTGLANRNAYEERIKAIENELNLPQADLRKHPISMGLIMIDVNYLKRVNDDLGHRYGDLLIKSVAELLKHGFREKDQAARIGGDEFVVFIPDLYDSKSTGKDQLEEIANRLDSNQKTIGELLLKSCGNDQAEYQKLTKDLAHPEFLDIVPSFGIGKGLLNPSTTNKGKNIKEAIGKIDENLYQDKNRKKNPKIRF